MMPIAPFLPVNTDRLRCWLTPGHDGAWPQRETSPRKRSRPVGRSAAAEADPSSIVVIVVPVPARGPSAGLAGYPLHPGRQPIPHSAR